MLMPTTVDFLEGNDENWKITNEVLDAQALTTLFFERELIVRNTFLDFRDFSDDARRGSNHRSRSAGGQPAKGSRPIDKRSRKLHCYSGSTSCCSGSSDVADKDAEVASLLSGMDTDNSSEEAASVIAGSLEEGFVRSNQHISKGSGLRERIFVTNIPTNSSEEKMRAVFNRFGRIASVSMVSNGHSCQGYVNFFEADAALAAVARCEQGRLTMSDEMGNQCQLSARWGDSVLQTQQDPGQRQQPSDKATRRRRKKEERAARMHSLCYGTSTVPTEATWWGVQYPEFMYQYCQWSQEQSDARPTENSCWRQF